VVVGPNASPKKVNALEKIVRVIKAPFWSRRREEADSAKVDAPDPANPPPYVGGYTALDLAYVLAELEREGITSVLVEGGGETHFNFLAQGLVNRVHFLYAPLIITGRAAAKSVGGDFTLNSGAGLKLRNAEWKTVGKDLLLTAYVHGNR
jgi:riboflavin biosynthesis pyrimidine reductase